MSRSKSKMFSKSLLWSLYQLNDNIWENERLEGRGVQNLVSFNQILNWKGQSGQKSQFQNRFIPLKLFISGFIYKMSVVKYLYHHSGFL